jgi:F0F1-type ATP synthase assembly protein I
MSQKRPSHGLPQTRLARRAKATQQVSAGAMIPSMILVGLVGGYFLGVWLEGRLGGAPWVGLGGLVVGGAASVRKVIQILRVQRRDPNE